MNILFVDDEELLIELYLDEVNHYIPEHTVYKAYNGIEALEVCEKHPIDLIFSDFKMPRMDGLEFAKELKARKYAGKIILITGHHNLINDDNLEQVGVTSVLDKPIDFDELLNLIRNFKV